MKSFTSKSALETKQIAANLAKQIKNGVIALNGELGAGKTTFAQGFAKGLGIKEKIISPTFVLIRQHQVPITNSILYHIDLYRLENGEDFKNLGIEELINDENNLILIEWADKIKSYLPKNTLEIKINKINKDQRLIIVD